MNHPVLIIDAYSQIFRWYHAMPATFKGVDGMPVNAIFGMGKFLFQVQKQFEPAAGFFAFDFGKSILRLAELPEYKSNRPSMPEELRCQIAPIQALIDAFGWTRLQSKGYEADDIIATLVKSYPDRQFRIVTADKDIAQLICDTRVALLSPQKGGEFSVLDEGGVREKYGVSPALIPDYLALLGDSADFISGVPGIGAKTAAALLAETGPLEPFLDSPSSHPKWHAKIAPHLELIRRNLRLIRLNETVPSLPEIDFVPPKPDTDRLLALFEQYRLKGLIKELTGAPPASIVPPPPEDDLFAGML